MVSCSGLHVCLHVHLCVHTCVHHAQRKKTRGRGREKIWKNRKEKRREKARRSRGKQHLLACPLCSCATSQGTSQCPLWSFLGLSSWTEDQWLSGNLGLQHLMGQPSHPVSYREQRLSSQHLQCKGSYCWTTQSILHHPSNTLFFFYVYAFCRQLCFSKSPN